METNTDRTKKKPRREVRKVTYRMMIASLLAVMIAVRLGGGVVSASPDMCVAAAASLDQAKADYAATCVAPRVDCDPIDGIWYCSNQMIGSAAPGGSTVETPTATPPPMAPPTEPAPSPDVPDDPPMVEPTACVAVGESLGQAKSEYAVSCEQRRVDCDKIDGLWTCSSQVIGDRAPGGVTADNPDTPLTPEPTASATPIPTPAPTATSVPTAAPEPTASPLPTAVPEPTATAAPTAVPEPTATAAPTAVPEPTPEVPDGLHPDIVKVIQVEGRNPGGAGWADSYSVGNQCFCATTFDHNIGGIEVDTPDGPRTVRQVCGDLGPGPGILGRPIYNDVQCGNGPANDAGDEDDCPGRVDIGRDGCGHIGPRWDFTAID